MRRCQNGHDEHYQASIRNCLVTFALTYLILLLFSYFLLVPLLGHTVADYLRDVFVSSFAISAQMLAERFSNRLRAIARHHPPIDDVASIGPKEAITVATPPANPVAEKDSNKV